MINGYLKHCKRLWSKTYTKIGISLFLNNIQIYFDLKTNKQKVQNVSNDGGTKEDGKQ